MSWLQRTNLLIGEEALVKLKNAHVLVVGLGGVGSFAAEFIARAGVGKMTIVDGDVVDPTNRNRQLPALVSTHDLFKVDIMAQRLMDINPELELITHKKFMTPDLMELLMKEPFTYAVDCIDSVTPKLTMIAGAYKNRIPLVSSFGAGGKMDPTKIMTSDVADSYGCRLGFYVRKRLRRLGVHTGFKVVFSPEIPLDSSLIHTDGSNFKRSAYGTISYMPAAFGGGVASVVIRDIIEWKDLKTAK